MSFVHAKYDQGQTKFVTKTRIEIKEGIVNFQVNHEKFVSPLECS